MIQYSADGKNAAYCGYKFRKDPKTGYFLCSTKTDIGKRERLHCFVYRRTHDIAEIPDGYAVHHKDGNKSNNEPDNLELLSKSEHASHHASLWDDEKRDAMRQNLLENVMPKATAWHKTDCGREWHKAHYEDVKEKMHMKAEYVCEVCGKHYETQKMSHNRFCSNNCKSAFRRKSGVDNETRFCKHCGKEYTVNKYSKNQYCGKSCSMSAYWSKKNNA